MYAKESGFVKELERRLWSARQEGEVLAVLEIPELQLQLKQDDAAIKTASDQITHAQDELNRVEAQHKVLQLQYDRLNSVAKTKPGLVAQQEVDDAQGQGSGLRGAGGSREIEPGSPPKASSAPPRPSGSTIRRCSITPRSPRRSRAWSRSASPISAPDAGRHQFQHAGDAAGAALQDDLFRLVIPVPESYVRYIHIGDPVSVNVPSLNRTFPGKVARFSVDVREDTRTMHTEVDVPNPDRVLLPGLYAEATITLEKKDNAVAVPLQAVDQRAAIRRRWMWWIHPTKSKSARSCSASRPRPTRKCFPACRRANWSWSAIAAA